jgi:hypothetical protein
MPVFSLRSQRLMAATTGLRPWPWEAKAEDVLIGADRRRWLEQGHGIRFASPSLAEQFSYEHGVAVGPTFGFHGIFNLWRHIEDWEALEISRRLGQRFWRKWSFLEWLVGYAQTGRIALARTLLAEAGFEDDVLRKGISRQAGCGQRSLEVMAALGRA